MIKTFKLFTMDNFYFTILQWKGLGDVWLVTYKLPLDFFKCKSALQLAYRLVVPYKEKSKREKRLL